MSFSAKPEGLTASGSGFEPLSLNFWNLFITICISSQSSHNEWLYLNDSHDYV